MRYPNLNEEKKLWKKGHRIVVGIDEVGRGPLAGPVFACALVLSPKFRAPNFLREVKDSKKLSPKTREKLYKIITSHPQIFFAVAKVSHKIIDKINILNATKLAMKKAIGKLKFKKLDYLLIDGNFKLNDIDILQKSIIKGDEKIVSCALASIVAKVERDALMRRYHKKYPNYGFNRHKGYGTELHYKMLSKFGPSLIHRQSFYIGDKMFK